MLERDMAFCFLVLYCVHEWDLLYELCLPTNISDTWSIKSRSTMQNLPENHPWLKWLFCILHSYYALSLAQTYWSCPSNLWLFFKKNNASHFFFEWHCLWGSWYNSCFSDLWPRNDVKWAWESETCTFLLCCLMFPFFSLMLPFLLLLSLKKRTWGAPRREATGPAPQVIPSAANSGCAGRRAPQTPHANLWC